MNAECPICRTTASPLRKRWKTPKRSYTLHQCGGCDLRHWSPLHDPDPADYETNEHVTHLPQYEVSGWNAKRRGVEGLSGRILDVGCGNGLTMRRLEELGFEAHGLDFDAVCVRLARESGLRNVYWGSLSNYLRDHPGMRFDAVCFFDVLEHQGDPLTFLRDVNAALRPGGTAVATVPSRRRFAWGDLLPDTRPPYHLLEWSEPSLREAFSRAGFESVVTTEYDYGYLLRKALRPLTRSVKAGVLKGSGNGSIPPERIEAGRKMKRLFDGAMRPFIAAESLVERSLNRGLHTLIRARKPSD